MKIGVIADTHIPDRAKQIPGQVLEAFKGVDMVIHAGDLLEMEVFQQLETVCRVIKAVRGNMDNYEVRKKLPEKEVLEVGNYKIGVTHGYGHPDKLVELTTAIFAKDNVNLIIFGHSHQGLNLKQDGVLYFNPGSPTDKIFSPYNSYGIIEINDTIEGKVIRI